MEIAKPMLDSIEAQKIDWDDIEILLCSSSMEAFDLDLTNYPNIKAHSRRIKQDTFISGPGASWQLGVDNASGEYIWKLDIDDALYADSVFAQALRFVKESNYSDLIQLSYIDEGMGTTNIATEQLGSYSMAPWAWLMKTSFLRENQLVHNKYMVTKEDINLFGLLSYWISLGHFYRFAPLMYVHKNRKDSVANTIGEDAYKICVENYYYFLNNCKYFENRDWPIPTQVTVNYMWQYWIYAPRIKDNARQFYTVSRLTKLVLKKYLRLFRDQIALTPNYRKALQEMVFSHTLMVQINNDTSLNSFKETLMSIQCQTLNENTFFDVSKLQILCWGDIPKEIKEYNYQYEFPRIDDNIMFLDTVDYREALQFNVAEPGNSGAIPAGLILKNNIELYNYFIRKGV